WDPAQIGRERGSGREFWGFAGDGRVKQGKEHKDTKAQRKAAIKRYLNAAFLCGFVPLCLCVLSPATGFSLRPRKPAPPGNSRLSPYSSPLRKRQPSTSGPSG